MKTRATEYSNGVSLFKDDVSNEDLQYPSASVLATSSKRKSENETESVMHNVDKKIGVSPSLGNALENIVEQLDVLTLVSMQEQIALTVENNNFINGGKNRNYVRKSEC